MTSRVTDDDTKAENHQQMHESGPWGVIDRETLGSALADYQVKTSVSLPVKDMPQVSTLIFSVVFLT